MSLAATCVNALSIMYFASGAFGRMNRLPGSTRDEIMNSDMLRAGSVVGGWNSCTCIDFLMQTR